MMAVKKSVKKPAKAVAKKATQAAASKKRAMPSFAKAPPALVERFGQIVAAMPLAEPRQMFGYPAAFANGQMFASLFGDSFILRLPEAERAAFIKQYHSRQFEPMPGRPMREYVVVPPALLNAGKELDGWLSQAAAYAQSLPPKKAKSR
jgi:hypothetical protein